MWNIKNLRYADETTLYGRKWRGTKEPGLELNIQKMKIMASGLITSRQTDRETTETVRLYFLGLHITADGDCGHQIKRCLLLARKSMTNLDNILKSRDITLSTKVCLVKAMVFPVVMYGCESWSIMKAECWRIDAFKLWCWRRLLGVPWTARRPNQAILKEISPEYSLQGLIVSWNSNTLATWCKELTHLNRSWCWERLKTGREGDNRGWHSWMASPTQGTWVWANSGVGDRQGGLVCCSLWACRVRHDWATELLFIQNLLIKCFRYEHGSYNSCISLK